MSDSRTKADSRQIIAFGPSVARVPARRGRSNCRRGFTLVELLVVIGIIVILIGILIPTISHVRQASRAASTQSLLVQLQTAIEQYYQDYRAYPGPLSNDVMYGLVGTGLPITNPDHISIPGGTPLIGRVSGSENLVLALMGGLRYDAGFAAGQSHIVYDATIVGAGPRTLAYDFATGATTAKTNQVKNAYLASTADLTTSSQNNDPANPGHFKDQSGEANDSTIPEFVDRFQSPMPILYLRARVGANNFTQLAAGPGYPMVIGDIGNIRGSTVLTNTSTTLIPQYDISQYFGYVGCFRKNTAWPTLLPVLLDNNEQPDAGDPGSPGRSIGEDKSAQYYFGPVGPDIYSAKDVFAKTGRAPFHGLSGFTSYPGMVIGDTNSVTPAQAPAYFRNPAFIAPPNPPGVLSTQDQPRGRDSYILISPGPDRVYGTADDITSFGAVLP